MYQELDADLWKIDMIADLTENHEVKPVPMMPSHGMSLWSRDVASLKSDPGLMAVPEILVLWTLSQEDHKFVSILGYM